MHDHRQWVTLGCSFFAQNNEEQVVTCLDHQNNGKLAVAIEKTSCAPAACSWCAVHRVNVLLPSLNAVLASFNWNPQSSLHATLDSFLKVRT
jgi:hypothetical protein